jgi:hypothetical protein
MLKRRAGRLAAACAALSGAPAHAGPWSPEAGEQYLSLSLERFDPDSGPQPSWSDGYASLYFERGLGGGVAWLVDVPIRQSGEETFGPRLGLRVSRRRGAWSAAVQAFAAPGLALGAAGNDATLSEVTLGAGRSLGERAYAAGEIGLASAANADERVLVWRIESGARLAGRLHGRASVEAGRSRPGTGLSRRLETGQPKIAAAVGAALGRGVSMEVGHARQTGAHGASWRVAIVLQR